MSSLTETVPGSPPANRSRFSKILRENLTGYAFIFPAVLIIGLFGVFPIGYSIYMSLFNWRARKGPFTGLRNYENLFGDWTGLGILLVGVALFAAAFIAFSASRNKENRAALPLKIGAVALLAAGVALFAVGWDRMYTAGDTVYLKSLVVTLFYALGAVPLELILGLIFAYILFQNIKGKSLFRMVYFLPYVTPIVATAVVFNTIFSPRETAMANVALGWLGQAPLRWLFEPRALWEIAAGVPTSQAGIGPSLALIVIILFGTWTFFGYNTVIFLAGLGSISPDLYEAAEIDGANGWNLFTKITIPLLSPVTFYLFLISFIGTFRAFNHIYVMMTPNAQDTVVTASVKVFNTFYVQNNYGYAAAQAIVLFLIILGLTLAQNKLLGERVFYG